MSSRTARCQWRVAVTVGSVASDDDRPTKRPTIRGRGRAAETAQLGSVQRLLLRWLLWREQVIGSGGSDREREDLRTKGVVWRKVHLHIEKSESAVSVALRGRDGRSLEARGLVDVRRGAKERRVTHVKLTSVGRRAAQTTGFKSPDQRRRLNYKWAEDKKAFGPREGWSDETAEHIEYLLRFLEDRVLDAAGHLGERVAESELRAGSLLSVYGQHKPKEVS